MSSLSLSVVRALDEHSLLLLYGGGEGSGDGGGGMAPEAAGPLPATAVEQIPEYYDEAPRWAPLLNYNTPTMEVPATQPLFVDRSAAVRTRTLVSLVCPAVSILAASVAVVAEQDSRRRCDKALALGRRRFATSENVGYTWRSVVELSQDEAQAAPAAKAAPA